MGTNPCPESYDAISSHSPRDQRARYGRRGSIHLPTSRHANIIGRFAKELDTTQGRTKYFEANFYTSEKKVLELTRQLHEEQTLNTYIAPKRMRNFFLP